MVGWHHRLDGHEFEQALGIGEGNGNPLQCSCLENIMDRGAWDTVWDNKESDMTE